MKKVGFIDGRRIKVGGVPMWAPVPGILIPGAMEAYGILEDFETLPTVAANGPVYGKYLWTFKEGHSGQISLDDVAGGIAKLECGATDNDTGQIIMGQSAGGGIFFPAADKHIWFEARAKVSINVAAEFNYYLGLIDPIDAEILVDDGAVPANPNMIGFIVRDGESNWSFMGDKAAAQDINGLGSEAVVDTDYHYFGFYVNGVTSVTCYYDRVAIAAGALATANIPIIGLMPALAVKGGGATPAIEYLRPDYVMCVQLR